MSEAGRQRALLDALYADGIDSSQLRLRESDERAARGIEAYRANTEAIAERALTASFETVRAMVGEASFARLARDLWRERPPVRGDLAEWGGAFPAWLGAHAWTDAWPYLGDCARLDWAVHCNERAADAGFDGATLALLASSDPALVRLHLMPGTALLQSAWPIASIHAAHRLQGDEAERAFAALREAIAAGRDERVMVVRSGWRAVLHRVDRPTACWLECLLEGASLEAALERAGPGFDFSAWLATALRESWLQAASVAPSR
jgi:Putative DNA-binding domain